MVKKLQRQAPGEVRFCYEAVLVLGGDTPLRRCNPSPLTASIRRVYTPHRRRVAPGRTASPLASPSYPPYNTAMILRRRGARVC